MESFGQIVYLFRKVHADLYFRLSFPKLKNVQQSH
jgi:hypothetical protein